MRVTLRLLAKVQPTKFLEVGAPTGLTGILTHPQPRSTLLYTYNQILNKLKALPESSVYRQSTEAITKSRLKIVEDTIPAGYAEWQARIKAEVEKDPAAYSHVMQKNGAIAFSESGEAVSEVWGGQKREVYPEGAYREAVVNSKGEAARADEERQNIKEPPKPSALEQEPPLDVDQINEIETKIGAGLIEEVIMVADGELTLVDEMIAARVWEPLDEKPAPGQWEYFERGTHTGTT